MNLEDKTESKNTRKSLEFRKTLEMCFFCGKKDEPKNQTLKLHNPAKNNVQNLNDFSLIAKLSKRDMVASDAKYYLNCLTYLYQREKKMNCSHCDEPVEEQIMKGTLVFSFRNSSSTNSALFPLTKQAPELIIVTSLFQMLLHLPYKQRFCKNFVFC